MEKSEIRRQMLSYRASMSDDDCMEKSTIILKRLYTVDAYLRAWKVGLYASCSHEVITYPLIGRSMQLDKGVAFPRIVSKENREMEFGYILGMQDLKAGAYGILEPASTATIMEKPDVLIMPLVAFDGSRNRIGCGGGFYDRYLQNHPETKTIALAFEWQKCEQFDPDAGDVRPDMIITEENIYE